MKHAAVIGSGIGGLATAVRLRLKGWEVTVYEANSYVGGKMAELVLAHETTGKFRFDMGPSLFTMPHFVDELFTLAGRNPRDYFRYRRLDPVTRYFYPDGTVLDAFSDPEKFDNEVHTKLGERPGALLKALRKAGEIYDITNHVFLERSLHKLSTYLRTDTLRSMAQLHKIDAFRTLHAANARRFRSPQMVQLFDRFATYNGSNPYVAPATLNIIPHLEHHFGAWFPEGGMAQIPLSIRQLAEELGVIFRLNTRVDEILVNDKKVVGVKINGQTEPADLVVSNMDVVPTYRRLLPSQPAPEFTLNQPRSGSAVIFYWAMNTTFSQLDSHNIFFASDYEAEFRAVWERQTLADDVTTYVFISSKQVPSDAPTNCENWFVLVNAPANTGQDWDALIARTRQNVLAQVSASLGRDVAAHIVAEDVLDPRTIESRTSSYQGALYGSSSNNKFAAFLRHPNFSQHLEGLYFCGGSVHPGGGIPLCLLSAKIVGDLVG